MADEQNYETHLLDIQDALKALDRRCTPLEHLLVSTAYELWQQTQRFSAEGRT